MDDIRTMTTRAIHDAMALHGPQHGGGFIRTASPDTYMDAVRLRTAREVLRQLPLNAATMDHDALIDRMMPVVLRCRLAMPDAAG